MILVIGDQILDMYVVLTYVKESQEGAPVAVEEKQLTHHLHGGGDAVCEMLSELGSQATFVSGPGRSIKTRYVLDGKVLLRVDENGYSQPDDSLAAVRNALKSQYELIVVSDYGKGTVTRDVIDEVIAYGVPVICDPYPKVHPRKYHGVTFICPNEPTYWDHPGEWRAVAETALVKQGEHGVTAINGDTSYHYPAIRVSVCDTCGAGDQFIAAFSHYWLKGNGTPHHNRLSEACRRAVVAAGVKCHFRGCQPVTERMIDEVYHLSR